MSPAHVLALQRAAGNAAVTRIMVQRHRDGEGQELEVDVPVGPESQDGGPRPLRTIHVQRRTEVFNVGSTKPFDDPVKHLGGSASEHRVFEDPGSLGILGGPDATFITALGDPTKRDVIVDAYGAKYEFWENKRATEVDATKAKAAENKRDEVGRLMGLLNRVTTQREAATFYQQNTLGISAVGLSPKTLHNKGNKLAAGHKVHVFHRDTGYLTIAANVLEGENALKRQKAEALNGPFNSRGWVRGHHSIDNMRHRFIEHIHVDKKDDNGMDIFSGTAAQADQADGWASKGDLLKPKTRDLQAYEAVHHNQVQQDIATY